MKTLEEHNAETLAKRRAEDREIRRTGVACPKCLEEMLKAKGALTTQFPGVANLSGAASVECPKCGWKDVMYV